MTDTLLTKIHTQTQKMREQRGEREPNEADNKLRWLITSREKNLGDDANRSRLFQNIKAIVSEHHGPEIWYTKPEKVEWEPVELALVYVSHELLLITNWEMEKIDVIDVCWDHSQLILKSCDRPATDEEIDQFYEALVGGSDE